MIVEISDIPEEHMLMAGQIKIEPLSEDDALKFHHGTESQNPPTKDDSELVNDGNSADCDNFEIEYLEEDIKPTLVNILFFHSFLTLAIR